MSGVSENKHDRLQILSTANLIRKLHQGCDLDEIYEKGVRYYDVLLSLLENGRDVREISELTGFPSEKVKFEALRIVNFLLFNKRNDAFLSLGLSAQTAADETKRRWKRLLMLYHPDRSLEHRINEEMTKRINEAYSEITAQSKSGPVHAKGESEDRKPSGTKVQISPHFNALNSMRIYNFKYLKYLPFVILAVVVSFAILSLAIFFMQR